MTPRKERLHSHRNFGIRPLMEDDDGAPYVIVWAAGALVFWIVVAIVWMGLR